MKFLLIVSLMLGSLSSFAMIESNSTVKIKVSNQYEEFCNIELKQVISTAEKANVIFVLKPKSCELLNTYHNIYSADIAVIKL